MPKKQITQTCIHVFSLIATCNIVEVSGDIKLATDTSEWTDSEILRIIY